MEVIRLPNGVRSPDDVDQIAIELYPDGGAKLTGTILAGEESRSIVDGDRYDSRSLAESAGAAWAAEHGVRRLYVVISNLSSD